MIADEVIVGWRPGLLGCVVAMHGCYYAREWGLPPTFEAGVARDMAAFVARMNDRTDRISSIDVAGRVVAALTIDGGEPGIGAGRAHLRWFIVDDGARGRGHGRLLMGEAMRFLHGAGYRSCYLTTFAGLDAARALYERAGFALREEASGERWGRRMVEQRFEWHAGRHRWADDSLETL